MKAVFLCYIFVNQNTFITNFAAKTLINNI